MYPILLDLGKLSLPTYGLLMAAAFLLALRLAHRLGRRAGVDAEQITNVWIWVLIGGILGAKLLLYVVDWRYYLANPDAILGSWRSAGVYYGGFAAATLAGIWYARRSGLPVGRLADVVAAPVALGQSVGRLGCLAAGCCYGRPTDLPWAITFTDPRAAGITGVDLGVPLHPSQVYLSLNALVLCGLLLWLFGRKQRHGWPDGIVFWSYILLYSASRFLLEFYRDDPRGSIGPLSTSQALSLAGIAVAGVAVVYLFRRRTAPG